MIFIVMGVTGSGKTTVGRMLADRLGLPFYDADDLHAPANVRKMASGRPLTDEDRVPWLERISGLMAEWERDGGAVLACSALKEQYRDILSKGANVRFVYLKASEELVRQRLAKRRDHFMPSTLVDSQFQTLEEPEEAITIDAALPPEEIVEEMMRG